MKEIEVATDKYRLRFSREIELLRSVPDVGKKGAYQYLAIIGDHTRFTQMLIVKEPNGSVAI